MNDEELRNLAKERVEMKRGLLSHIIAYIIVNGFLVLLNLKTSPHTHWFIYPLLGWGIGLLFHIANTIIALNNDGQSIDREMERLKKKRQQ